MTIEPFNLRDKPRQDLCIDRLAYWYYHPREWLKKAALMDDVYLLNSPFTFQSMEKHSAYCAMLRLGLNVPNTVLVPYKHPVDNARWAYPRRSTTSSSISTRSPATWAIRCCEAFDGGGWRGVSRVRNSDELHKTYDESCGLMHLQESIDFDVFARALTIRPESMVMKFRPTSRCTIATRVTH